MARYPFHARWLLAGGFAAACGYASALPAQAPPDWSKRPPLLLEKPFVPPVIERTTLSNGLQVLFVARTGVPLIQINLVAKGGSTEEPPGKFGLAHVAGELMSAGAGTRTEPGITAAAERLGVSLAVRSDRQSIQVLLRATTGGLDSALALMSDVALRPTFPADAVRELKGRLLTTISQLQEDAGNLAAVALSRAVFGERHPDGQSSLGRGVDVLSLSRTDLVTYHSATFRPDRVALVVVGDVRLHEIQPLLETAFGRGWPSAGDTGPSAAPAVEPGARRVWLVERPGASQSSLRMVAPMPRKSSTDYFALEVLNMVLGGSTTSRIGQNLRDRHGYTYETRSFIEWRRGTSLFIAYANVEAKVTAAAVRLLWDELTAPRPITPSEILAAKSLLRRSMPQAFMTVGGVAGLVGDLFLGDLTLDFFGSYASRVDAVTAADLTRVMRAYLAPERIHVVIVGDPASGPDIQRLGLGHVRVLNAGDLIPKVN